ncbi:hypothetical protein DENSPDRAFT_923666 [Dentipellis sp. KUC8613]|nr:hypothetical protein DENSPDRAFT_923666 [Dentipellis sp. KUC8613]
MSLSPQTTITDLPVEMLAEIFLYLAATPDSLQCHHSPMAWLAVTHVCAHWRAVALSLPAMWHTIPCDHPELTKLLLARSKNSTSPLTLIHPRWARRSTPENMDTLLLSLPRVHELAVAAPPRRLTPLLTSFVSAHIPALTSLAIHCSDPDLSPSSSPSTYSPRLTTSPLSPLRSLTLSGFLCPIAPAAMDKLLAPLTRLPRLESLTLAWTHPAHPIVFVPPHLPARDTLVRLPHLRTLNISGLATACALCLRRVDAPPAAALCVRAVLRDECEAGGAALRILREALRAPVRARGGVRAVALEVRPCGFELRAEPGAGAGEGDAGPVVVELDTRAGRVKEEVVQEMALDVLCMLRREDVRTLSVCTRQAVLPRGWWERLGGALPGVCTVEVRGSLTARGVMEMFRLGGRVDSGGSSRSKSYCIPAQQFPVLRHLRLAGASLSSLLTQDPPERLEEALVEGCEGRKLAGAGLESMLLYHCEGRAKLVEMLMGVCGLVEVMDSA